MSDKFLVTSSPHIKAEESISSVMSNVIIALIPVLIISWFYFGVRVLFLTAITVASCIFFEYIYRKLMKKNNTIGDLSAIVTGILLAYNLPVSVPFWIPIVGSFFAIVVVKELFGGLGNNFVNPALAARVFLFAWPGLMTNFTAPVNNPFDFYKAAELASSATPLVTLKAGNIPDTSVFEMLLGYHGGSMGETAGLMLIVGGLYLIYKKIISWHIPVTFIGTVCLLTYFFNNTAQDFTFMTYQLFAGGLLIGAIFMATDYITSPITSKGRIIFGIICGLLTVFIRYFGGYPEGVSFAILLSNLLVPFIDRYTPLKRYGGIKGE